jgi:hypothetical protein
MSPNRHLETDVLTTRQQYISATSALFMLLRWNELDRDIASSGIRVLRYRALGIERTPFHANFGFSPG